MNAIHNALAKIKHGTVRVAPEDALEKKLSSNKKLKIKLGVDPTAPDLHLGHAVVLSKLKQFQDLGHEVVFLIGDFTARIGDPTGRSKTRPPLTEQEIVHNTTTYIDQVGKILDVSGITIAYNSSWLGKLTAQEMVQLCAKSTVARLIERDDFARRIKNKQPVGFHELLYPLFQGYDSVMLQADVELGGTDQTFNLMMGRFLQEQYGQQAQVVITLPLLEGLDGVEKMSKSLGNAIGLVEPADQAFGKLMSISDDLMWRYMDLLVPRSNDEVTQLKKDVASGNVHPMALKKDIAQAIVTKFWSSAEAIAARETFQSLFEKKDYSKAQCVTLPSDMPNPVWIVTLLKALNAVATSSEAKRLIESGAVSIDGETTKDFKAEIVYKANMIIKVGKHRIYKLA